MSRIRSLTSTIFVVAALVLLIGTTESYGRRSSHAVVAPQEIMGTIQDLCDIAGYGIHSGIHAGPTADQATRYILRKLRRAGVFNAGLEGPMPTVNPYGEWKVTVQANGGASKEILSHPLLWTVGTPEVGIEAEIAYVGIGEPSDFDAVDVAGKIALIDGKAPQGYSTTWGRGALPLAVNNGALAVIVADLQIPVPKITHGVGTATSLYSTPVFVCGKPEGDYMRSLITSGQTVTAKVMLDLPFHEYDTYNVVAKLRGNGSTDEIIVIIGHYETMFTGATDNNSGTATMLAMAKYFARKPRKSRNRDMIFVFAFGHEQNRNMGHTYFVEQHSDIMDKVIVFNIDHPVSAGYAYDETDGLFYPTGEDTIRLFNATSNPLLTIGSFSLYKNEMLPAITNAPIGTYFVGSGIQAFLNAGTPALFSGIQLAYYYHTIEDTMDKIPLEQIERSFAGHVEMLENIDRTAEGYLIYADMNDNRVIPNTPPEVKIEILSDTVKMGDTVRVWHDSYVFYDDKPDYFYPQLPSYAAMVWDWGDGTPTTIGLSQNHKYSSPGTYTITLTLTDLQGAEGTATMTVTVLP